MRAGGLAGVEQAGVLARELRAARNTDDVAAVTLRVLAEAPDVSRAALALRVAGGRQLRFVSSDRVRDSSLQWCLIDAYDQLPLNDAVRSGQDVVLPSRQSFADAYPALAARQDLSIQSVVALALVDGVKRVGGLLLYFDHEGGFAELGSAEHDLKTEVVRALRTVRTVDKSEDTLPPGHRLPADETAPALARQLLRGALRKCGVDDDDVDSALLCASEIVTNVVMHTAQPSVLTVEASAEAVTVQVRYPTTAAEPPTEPLDPLDPVDPMKIAGRGLALVDAVAAEWGVEHEVGHTCWWFRVE